jgi:pentatricopeptide repeat protein
MRVLFWACACLCVAAAASGQVMPDAQARRESFAYYERGQEHLSAERWEKAAESFRRAIERHRYFTDAYYALGVAYMALQRYTSAALAFQDCLEATRALHLLSERQRATFDRVLDEQAREMADTARRMRGTLRGRVIEQRSTELLAMRPSLGEAYQPPPRVLLALGSAHFRNGDPRRAEYYWHEAVQIDDSLGEAWNNLAAVYASSGRIDEARAAIREAERAGFRVNPGLKRQVAMK